MLSDTEFKGEGPAPSGSRPPLTKEEMMLSSISQVVAALDLVRDVLMGPLGVKTLDPEDPDYDGVYLDGSDNYHQGPEWLFPAGKER